MHIRRAGGPDEPSDDDDGALDEGGHAHDRYDDRAVPGAIYGPDGSVTFQVARGVIAAKFVLAGLIAVVALLAGYGFDLWLGLVVAAGVAAYGLRDVLGRERLHADRDGIRVGIGFAGHRSLAWSQLEQLRVDERSRFGVRSGLLELDAGEEIYLLSRYDLGTEPQDALGAVLAVRDAGA